MSKRGNDDEINEKSKQQKLNDINTNEIVPSDFGDQESPPAIYKLNAICCDDLFEWLSLRDLHSLGQTCKRMQRLTSLYFHENYKGISICNDQNIYYGDTQINGFIPFVHTLRWRNDHFKRSVQYNSLRHLSFSPKDMIDCCNVKLDKIETVDLRCLNFHINFHMKPNINLYDNFLKLCPNLKNLYIRNVKRDHHEWLHHKYPKLEYLMLNHYVPFGGLSRQRIQTRRPDFRPDLRRFFEQNTHIKRFETNHDFLMEFKDVIINSKMQLDVLTINECSFRPDSYHFKTTCTLLNKLYDDGFYKRLYLKETSALICHYPRKDISMSKLVSSLSIGLEKLSITSYKHSVHPPMINLKELYIDGHFHDTLLSTDFEAMTVSFPNLRQIHLFKDVSMDQLVPLIYRLPKLKELSIKSFIPTDENLNKTLDLSTLNAERKKLPGACKLTIFLPESDYLKAKYANGNMYANHDLIEIKRLASSKYHQEEIFRNIDHRYFLNIYIERFNYNLESPTNI